VSDGLVNGSSDWKDLAEWSDEIKQNRLLPSKLPLEYRAKDLSDLLFKLLEKDPWKRPSRVGELFFLDFFASESWLRDFEEIEAELMRIPSQQVESMVEGKFSAQKFLNFTDQERNKWRQNLCIPAALQLDHSVEGMESEVNALIDCCDCAKSQAQALRELEMDDEHDHSRLTFELAEKLEIFIESAAHPHLRCSSTTNTRRILLKISRSCMKKSRHSDRRCRTKAFGSMDVIPRTSFRPKFLRLNGVRRQSRHISISPFVSAAVTSVLIGRLLYMICITSFTSAPAKRNFTTAFETMIILIWILIVF
jgi:serine/threonine protein kinase